MLDRSQTSPDQLGFQLALVKWFRACYALWRQMMGLQIDGLIILVVPPRECGEAVMANVRFFADGTQGNFEPEEVRHVLNRLLDGEHRTAHSEDVEAGLQGN